MGDGNGQGPEQVGPPKAMVPMITLPVPQAFEVLGGDMGGHPGVFLRIESPMSTTMVWLDHDGARKMADQLREAIQQGSGLSVVSDPLTVQDILRGKQP